MSVSFSALFLFFKNHGLLDNHSVVEYKFRESLPGGIDVGIRADIVGSINESGRKNGFYLRTMFKNKEHP